jgi:hypothetical protein
MPFSNRAQRPSVIRQELNSETFVVPEGERDAVAKGVEKVVLLVASWIADTKNGRPVLTDGFATSLPPGSRS